MAYPRVKGFASRRGDLKLDWLLCFTLHHHCTVGDVITMADISDFQRYQITATQLAVETQVKKSKLSDLVCQL